MDMVDAHRTQCPDRGLGSRAIRADAQSPTMEPQNPCPLCPWDRLHNLSQASSPRVQVGSSAIWHCEGVPLTNPRTRCRIHVSLVPGHSSCRLRHGLQLLPHRLVSMAYRSTRAGGGSAGWFRPEGATGRQHIEETRHLELNLMATESLGFHLANDDKCRHMGLHCWTATGSNTSSRHELRLFYFPSILQPRTPDPVCWTRRTVDKNCRTVS